MTTATKTAQLWVKLLIAEHGRSSVLAALAEIEEVDTKVLEKELDEIRERKTRAKPKRKKSALELLQDTNVGAHKLTLMKQLGCAYESSWYLPEMWRVRRFLERYGIDAGDLKTRNDALPKVVEVLHRMSEAELTKALSDLHKAERGEFALLADQIMGSKESQPKRRRSRDEGAG